MSEHGRIKFWQEIGRRNVLRVAAVYVGFSWAVVHSGVVVGEALELPHWIMRLISALLIVGFPAVVAFAWVYEITPEGLKRTVEVEKDASLTHRTAQRLNVVIIALMILLAGLYGIDRFLLPHEAAEGSAHLAAEGASKTPAADGVSIAVLPFVNLSSDKEQEFFSDGMTEEITSALAKVKGLRVVGRTSAFEFKGQNKDLHAIGQALRAGHLLEGSVRKEGNKIRVTAQLISAEDGSHIWTENYDRELTGVFAIQDEISQAIARALRIPLGLERDETLVTNRAINPENYQEFLRAKALVRSRGNVDGTSAEFQAIGLLETVIAGDPTFAPAFALLGYTYALLPGPLRVVPANIRDDSRSTIQGYLDKAQAAATKAIQLDSKHVGGYLALAYVQAERGKWGAAEDLFKQAATLDPDDPDVLHEYSVVLAHVGKLQAALKIRERLLATDPLVPIFRILTAGQMRSAGRSVEAIRILEALPPALLRNNRLAESYVEVDRFSEAADLLFAFASPQRPEQEQAAKLLRMAPKKVQDPGSLPPLYALSFVYIYIGAPERALDYAERSAEVGYLLSATNLWDSRYSGLRKSERYKALMRSSGLVDYWRARGWPEVCHPVGADDFVCE
jgi:TolB-like protein